MLIHHQVALPPNYPYTPISQHVYLMEPAKEYQFELDPFQKAAIASIERSESVLVSAHTSAGKTVVAEYAIALALKNKQRVIYTSPIKALSNQKYRELESAFGDVGLLTGDVTINPNASCLVMTTEILLAMLYRGNDVIMREVSWVVFDEIHYMRDKVRGVVWEEALILLPRQVHFVFLSATIPNAMEFAEWICKIHAQPCHVVYTDFRPTPLQHYIYPCGGDGIFMVVDENGVFKEDNFLQATQSLLPDQDVEYKSFKGKKANVIDRSTKGPSDIIKIINMIMQRDYQPVIIFSFGKSLCETYAMQIKQFDFNNEEEKRLVKTVFDNAIDVLDVEDRQLPQIKFLYPYLLRGIAFHHSGLLPLLKEIVELLFQEGLIKVLFATETFAMGLNMPARTVVFTDVKKFDGELVRYITSGEYIQMSGRAGRRGIDTRGIVILMAREKMAPNAIKEMIMGESDNLTSAFHLKYNMILNMMRVEGISPEFLLKNSFYQFQNTATLPALEEDLRRAELEYSNFIIPDEDIIAEYYDTRRLLDVYTHEMRQIINLPSNCLQFLKPGRLVRVRHADMDFGWGMVVAYGKRVDQKYTADSTFEQRLQETSDGQDHQLSSTDKYFVDVLLYCDKDSIVAKAADGTTTGVKPCKENGTGEMMVVPVELNSLYCISQIRIFPPKSLVLKQVRQSVYDSIQVIIKRYPNGLTPLDPIEDMGIEDENFHKLIRKIEVLEDKLFSNKLNNTPQLPSLYEQYAKKVALRARIRALKKKVNKVQSILHLDDLKHRKRVLRRIGYLTDDDIVTVKGRVACDINVGDEVVLTEMLLNGVFSDLSVEKIAALLSCFVIEQHDKERVNLREDLYVVYRRLQEIARNIVAVSIECKLQISEEEYLANFCPDMMELVYSWCQGKSFAEIMKMAQKYYDGHVIRVFRCLDELLRAMVTAAKNIGNSELEMKFQAAISKLRRGIPFAASLYTH
ncbi:antiviral helicase [Gigaspora margarita]|uniref:Antiviral helicase n=2 Tax=Gigaspora margarita TaxID=4874 RepID=A0A8H4A3P9_GIGMA|nr:antiviral helicase [Gigaspora margarita]